MHSHVWISLYNSWRGWNNLLKKTPRVRTINVHRHRQIDSLSASANIIAVRIGYSSYTPRHVVAYKISEMSEKRILKRSGYDIEDVQVCRKGNDVMVVTSNHATVRCWDINTKKIIYEYNGLTGSHNASLISSTAGCYLVLLCDPSQTEGRCSCPMHKALPGRGELAWDINKLSCGMDLRMILMSRRFEREIVHATVADGENVKLLLGAQDFTSMKVCEISPGNNKLKELSENYLDTVGGRYYRMNMSKPCVLLSTNYEQDNSICVSVAGRDWSRCAIGCFESDGCTMNNVTAFLYHAGLLILEHGDICIIRVKNLNDFENFDLDKMEHRIVKVQRDRDDNRVEHLAVAEYNSVPCIIATNENRIHIIEFN